MSNSLSLLAEPPQTHALSSVPASILSAFNVLQGGEFSSRISADVQVHGFLACAKDRQLLARVVRLQLKCESDAAALLENLRAFQTIKHGNIIEIYDVQQAGSDIWLVQQYMNEGDLEHYHQVLTENRLQVG